MQDDIAALVAIEKIRARLVQYCRAVDSHNLDLLKDVYWPGAVDDHGFFNGPAEDFATFNVTQSPRAFALLRHSISNVSCTFEGATAKVESYFFAYNRVRNIPELAARLIGQSYVDAHPVSPHGHDLLIGGRYFDTFEVKGGEWRIRHRKCVTDWEMAQVARGPLGAALPDASAA